MGNKNDEFYYTDTVHYNEPDYSKPIPFLTKQQKSSLLKRLEFLYGKEKAEEYLPELERIIRVYFAHKPDELKKREKKYIPSNRFTERDIILITYGDLIKEDGVSPLETLAEFCDSYLEGEINTLHILPFFPYSSDKGFSVIDFTTVDPHLGNWEDIEELEKRYALMFDGVFNHVSSKSRWFREFLNGARYYKDFFINFSSPDEITSEQKKLIFRPRTSDILSKYQTINGPRFVWTTFSQDQIDLNFKNPDVLLRVIEILLYYIRHGASIIRMDAVTYLWAEPGTSCIHLDQTHEIVKLFRDVLNITSPWVALITETNVPHKDNISYFGNGNDEAQMVYNFALPPLVLYTFYKEDATKIMDWAETLNLKSDTNTFFNFLDSHDGIGLMAVKDILNKDDINLIIEKAKSHGGIVSNRATPDGGEEPYEINITWFSALNKDNTPDEDIAFQVKRFVASRIIALVIQGVPGIYLHSMIGTENDIKAVLETKSKRAINRRVISYKAIMEALNDPLSKVSRIAREFGRLLKIRTKHKAFHPNGEQKFLKISPQVFSVLRVSPDKDETILSLINISSKVCKIDIPIKEIGRCRWIDLVSEVEWFGDEGYLHVKLLPYDILWLKATD
jgi:sucrose phosphorylase